MLFTLRNPGYVSVYKLTEVTYFKVNRVLQVVGLLIEWLGHDGPRITIPYSSAASIFDKVIPAGFVSIPLT